MILNSLVDLCYPFRIPTGSVAILPHGVMTYDVFEDDLTFSLINDGLSFVASLTDMLANLVTTDNPTLEVQRGDPTLC